MVLLSQVEDGARGREGKSGHWVLFDALFVSFSMVVLLFLERRRQAKTCGETTSLLELILWLEERRSRWGSV